MWEAAGFQVLAFDADDSAFARRMGHALGWDAGESPMDLEKDLFAHYTLVKKPKLWVERAMMRVAPRSFAIRQAYSTIFLPMPRLW